MFLKAVNLQHYSGAVEDSNICFNHNNMHTSFP